MAQSGPGPARDPGRKGLALMATNGGPDPDAAWLTPVGFDTLFWQLRDATGWGPETGAAP